LKNILPPYFSIVKFAANGARGLRRGRVAHPLGAAKRNRKPRRWAKFASEASEQRPSRGEAPRPDGWEAYERAKRANFPPISFTNDNVVFCSVLEV